MEINVIKDFVQSSNINFLIGSGLSRPFLPVLGKIEKQMADVKDIPLQKQDVVASVLYKEYFDKVILPNFRIDKNSDKYKQTIENYCDFLNIWNSILHDRCSSLRSKQVNIYSTNIDLFVENAVELTEVEFNDGFIGSVNPIFSEANFQKTLFKNSIHFQNSTELPVFNLLKIHGSINWKEQNEKVYNDFNLSLVADVMQSISNRTSSFPEYKESNEEILNQIHGRSNYAEFKNAYDRLLIVNPTKKKFSETVFDVHFYELMRLFSNSLEKENSILFVMGFSFEDEHIRNIVKRALKTNPTLIRSVFSYKDELKTRYVELMGENNSNLIIITPSEFNKSNKLEGDDLMKEFDFKAINRVFQLFIEKIPVHFEYGR